MRKIELFGLVIGLAAVIVLTFFMITNMDICIKPFEPIIWIRIPEIIMGIFSIIILIKLIGDKLK